MVKRKSEATDKTDAASTTNSYSILKSAPSKKHKTFDDAGDANNGAEVDFPRGGGTGLTNLETAQAKLEGRREADAEASARNKTTKTTKSRKSSKVGEA